MLLKVLLLFATVINFSFATVLNLVASPILDDEDNITIAEFNFEDTTTSRIDKDTLNKLKDGTLYCFHIKEVNESLKPCFTMLEWDSTLSYNLTYDLDINLYSLYANYDDITDLKEGIIFQKEHSSTVELPPVTPLKKITKTYADKKKDAKNVLIADDKNDMKPSDKTWLEANWKKMLVGFVLYNLVIAGIKGKTTGTNSAKKD